MAELLFLGTVILAVLYVGQISAILVSWQQTPTWSLQKIHTPQHSLAIIIGARNESSGIVECLQSVLYSCDYLATIYPEVAVTIYLGNDHSTDTTLSLARAVQDERLVVLDMPDNVQGKKATLQYLVNQTTADYLLFTDADCLVAKGWVATISSYFDRSQVVALTGLVRTPDSYRLIDHWQYLDIIGMMAMTAHGLYRGRFTLGNGANMAVQREIYQEISGRLAGSEYASGDDVFVMQSLKAQYPDRVRFLKAKEVIVTTATQPTWGGLWLQRRRWASKTRGYQERGVVRLQGFAWIYCIVLLVSVLCAGLTAGISLFTGVLLLMTKLAVDGLLLSRVADFFGYRRPFRAYLFVGLTHVVYIVFMGLVALLPSTYKWKGRRLR